MIKYNKNNAVSFCHMHIVDLKLQDRLLVRTKKEQEQFRVFKLLLLLSLIQLLSDYKIEDCMQIRVLFIYERGVFGRG